MCTTFISIFALLLASVVQAARNVTVDSSSPTIECEPPKTSQSPAPVKPDAALYIGATYSQCETVYFNFTGTALYLVALGDEDAPPLLRVGKLNDPTPWTNFSDFNEPGLPNANTSLKVWGWTGLKQEFHEVYMYAYYAGDLMRPDAFIYTDDNLDVPSSSSLGPDPTLTSRSSSPQNTSGSTTLLSPMSSSKTAIFGGAAGGAVLLFILVGLLVCLRRRKQRGRRGPTIESPYRGTAAVGPASPYSPQGGVGQSNAHLNPPNTYTYPVSVAVAPSIYSSQGHQQETNAYPNAPNVYAYPVSPTTTVHTNLTEPHPTPYYATTYPSTPSTASLLPPPPPLPPRQQLTIQSSNEMELTVDGMRERRRDSMDKGPRRVPIGVSRVASASTTMTGASSSTADSSSKADSSSNGQRQRVDLGRTVGSRSQAAEVEKLRARVAQQEDLIRELDGTGAVPPPRYE